jgi:hypothetical protein
MRTNSNLVEGILGTEYDGETSLLPYIETASVTVNRVAQLASARNMGLSKAELELIERWLSAHCYVMMDPAYKQRTTEGASGGFMGQDGKGFEASRFGQHALRLDWSGSLEAIDKRKIAKAAWLGSVPTGCPPQDPGAGNGPY